MTYDATHALILVDLQRDFMPTGALPVPEGDLIIPLINDLQARFSLIVATQDYHPAHHGSFASQHPGCAVGQLIELDGLPQLLWPDHCVQGQPGAQLVDDLDTSRIARVFPKGTDPMVDSYSGFFDNGHRKSTGMAEDLSARGVRHVFIVGLATDYCVKFTALDARAQGFQVTLIRDACRAVNLSEGDEQRALDQLQDAGVHVLTSDQL